MKVLWEVITKMCNLCCIVWENNLKGITIPTHLRYHCILLSHPYNVVESPSQRLAALKVSHLKFQSGSLFYKIWEIPRQCSNNDDHNILQQSFCNLYHTKMIYFILQIDKWIIISPKMRSNFSSIREWLPSINPITIQASRQIWNWWEWWEGKEVPIDFTSLWTSQKARAYWCR